MSSEPLNPTDAQRLSRLRILRSEARRRSRDRSDPGVHLAVIAIDGVGELAIGLCVRRQGVAVKHDAPLAVRLDRLVDHLRIAPSGRKGFEDLHKARNLVQHEGILPDREQISLWLAETEQLTDALIEASFGVGLNSVGSAAGVKDQQLRQLLSEAEKGLEAGEAEASFQLSWQALEVARRELRLATELFPPKPPVLAGRGGVGGGGEFAKQLEALSEQLELSAFTSEPAEWLWFRQRQGERFRGLPPSGVDAARAFAFVLACVLEFESYTERHNVERWERWRAEQSAPTTGRPNGPHIDSVTIGEAPGAAGGRIEELREWRFQLTDVPESEPSFDWAILAARDRLSDSALTAAHLSPAGILSVSCRRDLGEEELWSAVRRLLEEAKDVLAQRALEDAEDRAAEEQILRRFRKGIEEAGCPLKDLAIRMPRNEHRIVAAQAMVAAEFPDELTGNPSYLAIGLRERFPDHFPECWVPERSAAPYDQTWNNVIVPAFWDPRRVGLWAKEALAFDRERRSVEEAKAAAAEAEERGALAALQGRIEGQRA
ncbi:MAG TPA: hypothetical protein VG816_11910 [Solirubrobacterales bacterium]|nr:hypothetical protein [Solirubrobacterales bacterium]